MKRYEKYKPSGVEWIGDVPEGWGKMRFKNFITLKTDASNSDVKIGLENIESATGKFIETETEFEGNGVAFSTNDIVYGKLRPYLQKVWIAEFNGNAVGDFFVFRTQNNSCPNFVKYLMLSDCFTKLANSATEGAKMPRVSSDFILCLDYFLPPLSEQNAIATYLDAKCAKIDNVVAVQQKRIELLKELKQSIITHAVTRGLDKNAKLKDSGVEWIGEVPEGWKVKRLKYFVDVTDGTHDTPKAIDASNNTYPLITSKCIEDGVINYDLAYHISEKDYKEISKRSYVSKYDVIMPMIGTVGNPSIITGSTKFAIKNVALFRTKGSYEKAKWLIYLLNCSIIKTQFDSLNRGGVQNFISQDVIKKLYIIIPNKTTAIIAYLDKKCAIIDRQIAKVEKQIELLKEYKQSVITECVTGKRKVC